MLILDVVHLLIVALVECKWVMWFLQVILILFIVNDVVRLALVNRHRMTCRDMLAILHNLVINIDWLWLIYNYVKKRNVNDPMKERNSEFKSNQMTFGYKTVDYIGDVTYWVSCPWTCQAVQNTSLKCRSCSWTNSQLDWQGHCKPSSIDYVKR